MTIQINLGRNISKPILEDKQQHKSAGFFFWFSGHTVQPAGCQFPDQGWNPRPLWWKRSFICWIARQVPSWFLNTPHQAYFLFLQTDTSIFLTKLFIGTHSWSSGQSALSIQLSLHVTFTYSKADSFHLRKERESKVREAILLTLNSCQCAVAHQSRAESTTEGSRIETE